MEQPRTGGGKEGRETPFREELRMTKANKGTECQEGETCINTMYEGQKDGDMSLRKEGIRKQR